LKEAAAFLHSGDAIGLVTTQLHLATSGESIHRQKKQSRSHYDEFHDLSFVENSIQKTLRPELQAQGDYSGSKN
jgi:hypothetical protein